MLDGGEIALEQRQQRRVGAACKHFADKRPTRGERCKTKSQQKQAKADEIT